MIVNCVVCNKEFNRRGAAAANAKFCSYSCRSEWRGLHWTGPNHPQYQEGPRAKSCEHCGVEYSQRGTEAISEFRKRKFCSMECAKHGQKRRYGTDHPLYKEVTRRKQRRGQHGAWARAVISRDRATCQHCKTTGVQLHAHHILSYAEHPESRWDVNNGLTLCYHCHLAVHTASNANGVNSGNIQPAAAGDNPEPSFGRKLIEGVTTRGRAYRRWEGSCEHCKTFISKPWSDTVGKAHLFCSRACAGKHKQSVALAKSLANGSNSSTSALHESDDIV